MKKRSLENIIRPESPIVEQIRKALKDLGKHWLYQTEFAKLYGFSSTAMTKYGPRFNQYRARDGAKLAWAGTLEGAQKLRAAFGNSEDDFVN